MTRFVKITASAVVLVLALTACFARSRGVGSALRVDVVAGVVEVRAEGGSWRPLKAGDRVAPRDSVRTDKSGSVALLRDDGARLELAGASSATVVGVTNISLDMGSLLARTRENAVTVIADTVAVSTEDATFRVDKTFSVRVASYAGSVNVVQDADQIMIPIYRQVVVAGGILPREASPMTYVATDRWDRILLADALDVDRQLKQYGRAFNQDFPEKAASPSFYTTVAPDQATFVLRTIRTVADPADLLFTVVMAKVLGDPGRAGSILALRSNGTKWGVIAKIERVDPKRYVDAVIAAMLPRGVLTVGTPGGGDKGEVPGTPPPSSSPKPAPSPRGSNSPSPSPTPSPSPPPPSPSPSPSPSPCSPIDQLLQRCGGLLP